MVYRHGKEAVETVWHSCLTERDGEMFEMMDDVDLEIKKDNFDSHWKMQIHLREFLSDRSITQVRKLVNYIRESDTPDEEKKILNYVQEYLNNADDEIDAWEKKRIGYEQKVKFAEKELKSATEYRNTFKKNTKAYKDAAVHVKSAKDELKAIKSRLYIVRHTIDDILKNVMFCQKVIEITS